MVAERTHDTATSITRRRRTRGPRRLVLVPVDHPRDRDAAALDRSRGDELPEKLEYHDTGCELAPSCLACPLPRCKYDDPRSVRRLEHRDRDHEIGVLRRKHHLPVETIAARFGISSRQVFRILRDYRESR